MADANFLKKEEQPKKQESKRSMTLADGKEIFLDDLSEQDKKASQKKYVLLTGKGYKQKVVGYKSKKYWGLKNPPSTFVVPDFLRQKEKPKEKEYNERQKKYKDNLFKKEDLLEKTSEKQKFKNQNNQGLQRYIFINELRANINGIVYYAVPVILNVIFLIFNAFKFNFVANIIFSVIALLDILVCRSVLKSPMKWLEKFIVFAVLIVGNVALYFIGEKIPGWYGLIDVPYMIKLFFICLGLYYFGRFYAGVALCYAGDLKADFGNVVQVNAGKPRCGKTSSGVQDAIVLARLKWEQLKYDYYIAESLKEETFASGDLNKILEYEETKLAYDFYTSHKSIPCLWSNVGLFDKQGRASHEVTIEHLKGISRLPVYSVVFLDELGAMLKADDGLNRSGVEKPVDISDMFRLGGHFVKWSVIGSEQDFNHIFIDARRVVGFNKVILGQEWICKPVIAYGIFKFIKMLKSDSLEKTVKAQPRRAKILLKFSRYVHSIGFRKVKYSYANNTETGAGMMGATQDGETMAISGVRTRYMPSTLIGNYDDRAYRQLYPSYFDKKIKASVHKSMTIDGLNPSALDFVNSTTALSEKRLVVFEELKNFRKE